jgi:hypothetical protein
MYIETCGLMVSGIPSPPKEEKKTGYGYVFLACCHSRIGLGAREKGGNAISHISLDNWLGTWKVFERLHRTC